MVDHVVRWSGFASQSKPWQDGYEWAYSRGECAAELGCIEALEECGYSLDAPEADEFEKGADFAQLEQTGG